MYPELNEKEKSLVEKEAFDYGYDMFCAQLRIDNSRIRYEELKDHAQKGYDFARYKRVAHKKPSPILKKWFSIRGRCLGFREFDLSVDDIKNAIKDTRFALCPVTGKPLKSGEQNGEDWSIDRVNSSKGYTEDNIIVLSSDANKAKDDLDIEGIIRVATSRRLMSLYPYNQINEASWHRMCVTFNSLVKGLGDVPFCKMISDDHQHLAATNLVIMSTHVKLGPINELCRALSADIGKSKFDKIVKYVCQRQKRVATLSSGRIDVEMAVLRSEKAKKILSSVFDVMKSDEKYDKLLMNAHYSINIPDHFFFRCESEKEPQKERRHTSEALAI